MGLKRGRGGLCPEKCGKEKHRRECLYAESSNTIEEGGKRLCQVLCAYGLGLGCPSFAEKEFRGIAQASSQRCQIQLTSISFDQQPHRLESRQQDDGGPYFEIQLFPEFVLSQRGSIEPLEDIEVADRRCQQLGAVAASKVFEDWCGIDCISIEL